MPKHMLIAKFPKDGMFRHFSRVVDCDYGELEKEGKKFSEEMTQHMHDNHMGDNFMMHVSDVLQNYQGEI